MPRLLILDDDLAVGQAIGLIAENAGIAWQATASSDVFFSELEQWAPSHIALDLIMPGMDGVEVLRQLAVRHCRAKIIITSGVGSRVLDAARRSAAARGLDIVGVLAKPFAPSALHNLLKENPGDNVDAASGRAVSKKSVASDKLWVTENDLRGALQRHELLLAYQPKIECATGTLAGFEALVRWNHPKAGIVMPDRFVPLAEKVGLIDALTEQVIELALGWLTQAYPASELSLSVNISAKSLVDFQLGNRVVELCRRSGIKPDKLIFELTETSAMEDPVTSLDLLTRLRMRGFQLSIDDFGTGYSSMVQLVRLPFSEIKIDKSFVIASMQSQEARTVIRFIVELGHSLGLRVTAEGVEDAETLAFLNEVGCDFAQGFFIARPMMGDRVMDWVEKWVMRKNTKTRHHTQPSMSHGVVRLS